MTLKTAYQKRHNQHVYMANRGKTCINPNCNNKARVKGFCVSCYNMHRKYGGIKE